ncbi:MAG TPA: ferritin family protein [Sedimentisphaerales bacterium]|nr:ferritin family protein [Sedimentisphaerales bacterium]
MQNLETDSEVLEFAIAREVDAYNLFTILAERVSNETSRNILRELAQEELKHKERLEFELIRTGYVVQGHGTPPKPESDSLIVSESDYIAAMSLAEVMRWAARKERFSYRLYVDLAAMAKDPDSRDTLIDLAAEEVKHQDRFEKEYDDLMKSKDGM